MNFRWLAYVLPALMILVGSCKGGGGEAFLEIIGTEPMNGDVDFPVERSIAVRVSEAIDPASLTNQTFFLTDPDGAVVPSTVAILDEPNAEPSIMGTAAELTPDEPLAVITDFNVTVTTGLASIDGTTLEEDFQWTFKTLDAQWGTSELIEPAETATGASSSGQEIAVDPQLNAIAVWQVEDDIESAIYANRYTRVDLWGTAEPIDDGSGRATKPALAVDGAGNGFAVWERGEAPTRNIWTNRYDVEDGVWGTPMLLQNGTVAAARIPSVAADPSGNAIAVWVEIDLDTGREVVRAIRYESGIGWGNAETIGTPLTTVAGQQTAIGMDDAGNAIAVWDVALGLGRRVLWTNRYVAGLDEWGEEALIKSDDTTSADAFRLDVGADGTSFTIWMQDNGDDQAPRIDIWGARFSGTAWAAPERIDNLDAGDKRDPDVAVDGTGVDGTGIAYAVWSQSDPDFANIWAAQYMPGSDWGAPELIEPENVDPTEDGDAIMPRVDVNRRGNVFVVWSQVWDMWPSAWSNRRDPDPDADWMTAERIEDLPGGVNLPTIAVDEGRHAHALWLHLESGARKVRTNRFE